MLKSVLIVIVCLFMGGCNKQTSDEGAKELLTRLYKKYETDFLEVDIRSAFVDSLLSPEFARLIRSDLNNPEGEGGCLNWDPLGDCQDPEGIQLDTMFMTRKSDSVFCEVTLKYLDTTKTVFYKLSTTDGQWRIQDIGSRSVPSLYNYLSDKSNPD